MSQSSGVEDSAALRVHDRARPEARREARAQEPDTLWAREEGGGGGGGQAGGNQLQQHVSGRSLAAASHEGATDTGLLLLLLGAVRMLADCLGVTGPRRGAELHQTCRLVPTRHCTFRSVSAGEVRKLGGGRVWRSRLIDLRRLGALRLRPSTSHCVLMPASLHYINIRSDAHRRCKNLNLNFK